MAGYRALAAVGRSIAALLDARIPEVISPDNPIPNVVLAGTGDFERFGAAAGALIRTPAISIYCYRITVDRETRGTWATVSSVDRIPRIPLCMHFLVAAWDENVQNELEYLGLAVQILETDPILSGPALHPSGDWTPGDSIQIVADELGQDSMSEAFQALTTEYRLSLPYLARVVCIEGRPAASGTDRVATVLSASGGLP